MLVSLAIAELYYKFHSFLLEAGAFLVTWFVLGAVLHWIAARLLPRSAEGTDGR